MSNISVQEKMILQAIKTLHKNKKEMCNGLSCSECILGSNKGNYVDGLYDSDGDNYIDLCTAINCINDAVDDIK